MLYNVVSDLGLHCLSVAHIEEPGIAVVALVPIMLYFCSDYKPLVTDFVVFVR